jgi:hypothetical protein
MELILPVSELILPVFKTLYRRGHPPITISLKGYSTAKAFLIRLSVLTYKD